VSHAIESFRVHFGDHPLLLCIALLLPLLVVRRPESVQKRVPQWWPNAHSVTTLAGISGLTLYPAIAIWYASDPHFFDNAEPTMPAVAWLFHLGKPLYHPIDSPQRYAHIYGPAAFIVHALALALFGPTIGASKSVGAIAGIASLVFLFFAVRRETPAVPPVTLTGLAALLLLLFRNYSFWTRPDPLQLLCISASMFWAARAKGFAAAVMVGISSGILWNLKFTGPLYSMPVYAVLLLRTGRRETLVAAGLGVAVAAAPFLLLPNVSFDNYAVWVRLSASTGLLVSTLRHNLEWAAYLSLPLLLIVIANVKRGHAIDRQQRALLIALAFGMSGVIVAAAKPGAGPYHLLPFVPTIIYAVARQSQSVPPLLASNSVLAKAFVAFISGTISIALSQQAQLVTTMNARRTLRDIDDVRRFAETHAGIVEMGYGLTESMSFARPVLVFRYGSYLLDQPALREHQLEGVELPQATVDALSSCLVRYWLIPKGERPFTGVNGYSAVFLRPLYSTDFRERFAALYKLVQTTTYYDVWQCQLNSDR
jgi:hypothetical protein